MKGSIRLKYEAKVGGRLLHLVSYIILMALKDIGNSPCTETLAPLNRGKRALT